MTTAALDSVKYLGGTPIAPFPLGTVLKEACQEARGISRARFGFAFVTEAGLDALLDVVHDDLHWATIDKLWIVGLNRLITQPSAVRRLRLLERSQIRAFVGGKRMTLDTLLRGPRFHGKIVALDKSDRSMGCLIAGSANLTEAALGSPSRNFEAGIALQTDCLPASLVGCFNRWWEAAWDGSAEVTDDLLERYVRLRDEFLSRNPDASADFDRPSIRQIDAASFLWIESGAMSGGSRNQVEFADDLARYFGPVVKSTRNLAVAVGRETWTDRPLSYKITTFGVEIWRLSLPTEYQCGLAYPGRVIQFKREQEAADSVFRIDVADLESNKHRLWRRNANRHGHLGSTSGQRAFGFY